MDILNIFLRWILYNLDTMLFIYILKYFFCPEIKLDWRLWVANSISALLSVTLDNVVVMDIGAAISTFIFPGLILIFTYGLKGIKRIWCLLGSLLINLMPFYILLFFLSIFSAESLLDNPNFSYVGLLLDPLFIYFMHRKLGKKNIKVDLNKWDIALIISTNLVSILISGGLYELRGILVIGEGFDQLLISTFSFIMMLLNLFICIALIKSKSSVYYKNIKILNEYYMNVQLKYFEAYKEVETDTRRFRHDMNNHLICIDDLCRKKKYQALEEYTKELSRNLHVASSLIHTGNDISDAIINEKIKIIKQNNILLEVEGQFLGNLKVKQVDLCTIFANAIDNAIEAALKIENISLRAINIEIKNTRNFYMITFSNSIKAPVKVKNNGFITDKLDVKNHGFGIDNIKMAVEKYNGYIEIKITGLAFVLDIILPH